MIKVQKSRNRNTRTAARERQGEENSGDLGGYGPVPSATNGTHFPRLFGEAPSEFQQKFHLHLIG